jgi:hypothetical protein
MIKMKHKKVGRNKPPDKNRPPGKGKDPLNDRKIAAISEITEGNNGREGITEYLKAGETKELEPLEGTTVEIMAYGKPKIKIKVE